MHVFTFALMLCWAAAENAPADPCTNGSFEQLAPGGFPVDWGPVGTTVEVSSDAHSGRHSLRLLRAEDAPTKETGLNRGALIGVLQGGVDFHYKAISAENAELNVYVIPMTEEPVERTGSLRATYTVPEAHVGDGQWHHARLKYDFTDNPKVKWVHFAARIVGTAGELLLDDFSYVERVGPILRFGKVRIEEDPESPGERCTVRAAVENAGDEPADDVRVTIDVPDGFTPKPGDLHLPELAPDEQARAGWTVEGERIKACRFAFKAVSGPAEATTWLALAPKLEVRSFGPGSPVAAEGEPATLECVLENTGSVVVLDPRAEFRLPSGDVARTAARLAPGRSVALGTRFVPREQTQALDVSVRASAANADDQLAAKTTLVVGAATKLPEPSGTLRTVATDDYAVLENEHVRLAFRRSQFGYGPGELLAKGRSGWQTVGWLPRLSRLVRQGADGTRREDLFFLTGVIEVEEELEDTESLSENPSPPAPLPASGARAASFRIGSKLVGLQFMCRVTDTETEEACWFRACFELAGGERSIAATYELTSDKPCKLLAFDGPMLYVLKRDEAVFPGLEWLVGDEVSSGTLDIAEGHAHQVRYVVHPNMVTIPAVGIHSEHGTVGLIWDVHQKWDGLRDRPSVVFASPDRFRNQRSHLVGLFLPSVPEFVEPNTREAAEPYPLEPGKPIRLSAHIFADGTATDPLAAIDEWARRYGWPEPAPLPHGSYDREIQFSMQGYLESLWEPDTREWWTTKGSAIMSQKGRPRAFVADLLLGELLSPDENVRRACRARAEEVLAILGGEARIDAQRLPGRADLALAHPGRAAALLAGRDDQGAWRFDADQRHTSGPFVGKDYYDLGPDDAVEVGTCARRAFDILRYARIAGDREAYDAMRTTLELMESFRVPRAAQVWEVPVHTPDVLAAADAVDAYVEAYRFGGDKRWLRDAVLWARRGLPFLYLWDDPEKPFLVGASIPVFGATWYQGSWFGRPVQWNGLRYANALLKLAEYDDSYPWRQIAETVIRSAIHQQDEEGENAALWPDNVSAIDSAKCPWVFAPRQIIRNVLKLTGRDEDPATVILGQGDRRLHVTAGAKISGAAWDGSRLGFGVTYPRGEQGVVLVSNVARPAAVLLDGQPLAERAEIEKGPGPGWRYDPAHAYLSIRVHHDGRSEVGVEGAEFRSVCRVPRPADRVAFEFDDSPQGWIAAHDIGPMTVGEGALAGEITGRDPFLVRGMMRVEGDACPVIRLRMRVTAGRGGQLFWTTESSPTFAEDKTLPFAIRPDGQFHEYRLELGRHPLWPGQTITAIRIDPGGGALSGEFAIDYLRGEKP